MSDILNRIREIPQVKHKLNRLSHVDIFNSKNASGLIIKNDQDTVDVNSIFRDKSDAAYDAYQHSIKRPQSSHKASTKISQDKYTYNVEWNNPKFEPKRRQSIKRLISNKIIIGNADLSKILHLYSYQTNQHPLDREKLPILKTKPQEILIFPQTSVEKQ